MITYADYDFYSGDYHGKMSEAEYAIYAGSASAYIDYHTFGRIDETALSDNTLSEKIKRACCSCADLLYSHEKAGGGVVSSEKVGDYSVTYANADSSGSDIDKRLYNRLKIYLGATGLMYRGVENDR